MSAWTATQIETISAADDLHVSPFREDSTTYGTPTWIWSVVVDGDLYVRAYNGTRSSWYQAAVSQRAGRITVAGSDHDVVFESIGRELDHAIDEAYRAKYAGSPYLAPMLTDRTQQATVRILSA